MELEKNRNDNIANFIKHREKCYGCVDHLKGLYHYQIISSTYSFRIYENILGFEDIKYYYLL